MAPKMQLEWNPAVGEFRDKLLLLGPRIAAKYTGSALRKASIPALNALKAEVSQRKKVTGNLRRGVKTKVKTYPADGRAVAMTGFEYTYQTSHAGLIEFGTKNRKTSGPFASSFKTTTGGRGGFQIQKTRGNALFVKPTLKPAYPKSFFTRASNGNVVDLGSTVAYHPLKRAWDKSKAAVQSLVLSELSAAFENAGRDIFL